MKNIKKAYIISEPEKNEKIKHEDKLFSITAVKKTPVNFTL